MLRKTLAVALMLCTFKFSPAQILGGGTDFSNAVLFNQSWINGCPGGATTLSNQAPFESNTAIDPCAPAPACVGGTAISDVWFSFFAQSSTATIVINPSASFDVAIQAFSGNTCPGLTDIGCTDAGGIGATETLNLTGLTANRMYYFRIFGSSNDVSNRTGTGTYNFCSSTELGSAILAVEITNFSATKKNTAVQLNWTTASESGNSFFEIERSSNGNSYQSIGKVNGAGTTVLATHYSFDDIAPLTTALNYYRLKEVSANGGYKYSSVVVIRPDNNLQKTVAILSNPITDHLRIKISSDVASGMQLKVINDLGQVVCHQSGSVVKGDNIIAVDNLNHDFYNGIYTLQVTIDNEILNTKFIAVK